MRAHSLFRDFQGSSARLLSGLLLAASLATSVNANTFSDPFEIGVGARAMALGRAYVARPADLYGVFFNPASLDSLQNPILGAMQTQILSDVNYVVGMGAAPGLGGTVGLGYSGVFLPNIPVTTLTTVNGNQRPSQTGTTQYGNNGFSINYALPLSRFSSNVAFQKIRAGVALKYYATNFQGGGAGVNGVGGSGFDMDLGLLWHAHPSVTVGLAQKNVLPDSWGARINWSGGAQTPTPIETTTHLGAHVLLLGQKNALWVDERQKITLDVDTEWGYGGGRPLMVHWGLEWIPLDMLSLRVGMDQLPKPQGGGFGADSALTSGVGLRLGGIELDYAYRPFGDTSSNAAHFFAMSYDFGQPIFRRPEPRLISISPSLIPTAGNMAIEFTDVPRSHFAYAAISRLATLNLMGGYADGSFRPNQPVTRAEVVAILLQAVDIPPQTNPPPFTDVSSVHWAAGYITAAADRGVASGNADGAFKPQEKLTRAEAVAMIAKFLPESRSSRRLSYADVDESHWAYPAIRLAYEYNLLEFVGGNRFLPRETVTRAELAWMISNLPSVVAK